MADSERKSSRIAGRNAGTQGKNMRDNAGTMKSTMRECGIADAGTCGNMRECGNGRSGFLADDLQKVFAFHFQNSIE